MEDTEYLPTCGHIVIGRKNGGGLMDGKVLTSNIALFTECVKCDQTGEISVKQLEEGWNGSCLQCGSKMAISKESAVRN